MRLRTRMAFISAAAVAVVVVVAVVLAQAVARRELMREIDESLIERIAVIEGIPGSQSLADAFRRDEGRFRRPGPNAIFGRGSSGFDALFYQFITADGQAAFPADQPVNLPVEDADVALALHHPAPRVIRTVDVPDGRLRMITVSVPGGAFQLARSLQEMDDTLAGVTGQLTLAGAIGVVLAGLLGLVVARSALRPVDQLTETVEHVAETKELAARIEVNRDDEVGRLAKSFNAMLEALEESRVQQQQLVRDAGHELRTPLTALRTNIEVLARGATLTDEQRRELLDAASYELRELTDLTAELVELAADAQGVTEIEEAVRLDELVDRVADRYRRRTGRAIAVDSQPTIVEVRPSGVERAVANLIDNADKWNPSGAEIRVSVAEGSVRVEDHGPGIHPDDRARVFDRFYRADGARTTPGSGLGLAIVKKVVVEHGGEVFVEEAEGGGAAVGFRLPLPTT
jgi:two-component system sensor histidine kinase MprB